ncbi:MAG: hypothetical protein RJA87_768 [Pseudomonadota bacterium]|jgi:ElaB/YqjD/DUF883 family membrane-anchored ribosome-binding protein
MSTEQDTTIPPVSPGNGAHQSDASNGPVTEAALADLINRVEAMFREGLKALGAQTKPIIESAEDQFEAAQKAVSDQVRNRPLTATAMALGVGVVIGLLLGTGRRR